MHNIMRPYTWLLLLLLHCHAGVAQDYTDCSNHYFKNKRISTSACFDANKRWGKARAYDASGSVIYEKELRRVGGHSTVSFSYYDDGAVKKAEWSSAPDGGIQWYSSVTTFSQEGTITGITENNYDDRPTIQTLHAPVKPQTTTPPTVLKKPDSSHTAYCAVTYSTELFYINNNGQAVVVTATRGAEHTTVKVHPKETIKGGQFILAQQFEDPTKYYTFSVAPKYKKKSRYYVKLSTKEPEQLSKEVRRYYLEIVKQ